MAPMENPYKRQKVTSPEGLVIVHMTNNPSCLCPKCNIAQEVAQCVADFAADTTEFEEPPSQGTPTSSPTSPPAIFRAATIAAAPSVFVSPDRASNQAISPSQRNIFSVACFGSECNELKSPLSALSWPLQAPILLLLKQTRTPTFLQMMLLLLEMPL